VNDEATHCLVPLLVVVFGVRLGERRLEAQGAGAEACSAEFGAFLDGLETALDLDRDAAHAGCDGNVGRLLDSTCQGND
jgi:hypothetical protein